MNCSQDLIEAYLDEELDAAQHAVVKQHLAACPDCSEAYARLRRQKTGIRAAAPYYNAPPELRQSVRRSLERQSAASPAPHWRWLALAASFLLVASLSWNLVQSRSRRAEGELARNVLAGHLRSLLGNSLVDVASSDQHTVKPWFAGKLDFSPDVRDLTVQGFPLAGGRIDYLADRRVAALVYHRRQHVITLFIWPAGSTSVSETSTSRNGYNLLLWTDGSMTYWAVSDVSPAELETLRTLLK